MKNINFYQYETARITIKWNNIVQPYGHFKTAMEAFNFIDALNQTASVKSSHIICTPDGDIILKF